MLGSGADAVRRSRGSSGRSVAGAAALLLVLCAGLAGGAELDVAITSIDFRLDPAVVEEGGTAQVLASVANLGSQPIDDVLVNYLYFENEVTGLTWGGLVDQHVYRLPAGAEGQSTVLAWDTTGVDPGRYHFVAEASIVGQEEDGETCDNLLPRESVCSGFAAETTRSIVVRLSGDVADQKLVQPLFHDPDPKKEPSIPEGCIVGYGSRGWTNEYTIPIVNVGNEELPAGSVSSDVRSWTRVPGLTGVFEERDDLIQEPRISKSDSDIGLGARHALTFKLNFDFLEDSVEDSTENGYLDFAKSFPLQIRLDLFGYYDDEADREKWLDEIPETLSSPGDYNRIYFPEGAGDEETYSVAKLDVYLPVVDWVFPTCGDVAVETANDVMPGASPSPPSGVRNARIYVAVVGKDGSQDLVAVDFLDQDEVWRFPEDAPGGSADGLPSDMRGIAVQNEAGENEAARIYVSFDDGTVVAIEDSLPDLDYRDVWVPEELWRTNVGSGAGSPVLATVSGATADTTYVLIGADDGLHILSTGPDALHRQAALVAIASNSSGSASGALTGDPVVAGDRVFFPVGNQLGRVSLAEATSISNPEVELQSVVGEITTPLEVIRAEVDGEMTHCVFFGTASGVVYGLGESESMALLGQSRRRAVLTQAGTTPVSALAVSGEGEDVINVYAGTQAPAIRRVLFDFKASGNATEDEWESMIASDLPNGAIVGLTTRTIKGGDTGVFAVSDAGELLAYDEVLKARLSGALWGENAPTARFSFELDGLNGPTDHSELGTLVVRSGSGALYGLKTSFLSD